MIRRQPRSARTDARFPYTPLFRSCAAAIAINTPARLAKRRRIEGPCSLAAAISALHQLHASFIPAGDEADACGQGQVDGCSHHNDLHRPARLVERRAHEDIHQIRDADNGCQGRGLRSEEHTSELQSLMRISYAV